MNQLATMNTGQGSEASSPLGMFAPEALNAALKAAEMLANSAMVPKDFQGNPGNCLVAIQWGAEIGLAPLQAMQNIAVINGRPSVWGDALLALVQGSGALVDMDERIEGEGGNRKEWVAVCSVQRKGKADPVVRRFSWEDAEAAGLTNKQGPWKQYPKRMLQMRARGFALRDAFADVLKGLYVAEEAQDMPAEPRDITPKEDAKPAGGVDGLRKSLSSRKKSAEADDADEVTDDSDEAKAVIDKINASNLDQLDDAVALAAKLPDGAKEDARAAFRNRRASLVADGVRTALQHDQSADAVESYWQAHLTWMSKVTHELIADTYASLVKEIDAARIRDEGGSSDE